MSESILQFYKRIQRCDPQLGTTYSKEKPYFNVLSRQCNFGTVQFSYRDFYKVTLIIGVGKLYYADKWILVNRPAMLFSNPLVPYAWESISEEQKGMFCIFNEQFVQSEEKNSSLANSPLFKVTGDKVFFLDDTQITKVLDIYTKMQEENQSDYANKYDVLRCYLHLLVHTALKMQELNKYESHPNASQRITELFIELLDRQFPVDYPHSVLSKVVKDTTGKTTSTMIAERIIKECTQYLLHSNFSISEIAYSLGFENMAYFSKFYRKHTGKSPSEIREQQLFDLCK